MELMQLNVVYYLTASALGGFHALEPGHGKTVVAAYLVGTKGRKIDAVLLGTIVTLTHTSSVIILAIIAKLASTRISLTEESLHGYLGLVAGLIIIAVGIWMLVDRLRGKEPFHFHSHDHLHGYHHHNHLNRHDHPHNHNHSEDHHAHGHDMTTQHPHTHKHDSFHKHDHPHNHNHSEDHHAHGHDSSSIELQREKGFGYWRLLLLGVSGGLVPCPAAIAILLAAIGSGRLGEGLTYVLFFSLGLALVLITIGIVVVTTSEFASRFLDAKRFAKRISIGSAVLITLLGGLTLLYSVRHLI